MAALRLLAKHRQYVGSRVGHGWGVGLSLCAWQRRSLCSGVGEGEYDHFKPKIAVVGVGGAGGNAVNHMIASGLEGVEFLVANTDVQALSQSLTANRIQLGKAITRGLGAGAKPSVGQQAAEEDIAALLEHPVLEKAHMCFIAAGMGGGTGTGAAPVVAKALREKDVLTVGVATSPFRFEGKIRAKSAAQGLAELEEHVHTLIVINNQRLIEMAKEMKNFSFQDAFKTADDVLHKGVRTITDLIVKPGLINLDFGDVRTVLIGSTEEGGRLGRALMGTGVASGDMRASQAASMAIKNPLLDEESLSGATGLLINITGGDDLTMMEVEEAANIIQEEASPEAYIVWGASQDPALTGKISVSVVATGLGLG